MDMPSLISKLMALGLPLVDAIRASTATPAKVIRQKDLGHLGVGAIADVAAFNLLQGNFGFIDNDKGKVTGSQRLLCELTLKGGQVAWDWNGRTGKDYKTLGPTYGVRPSVDTIVVPK
jgi:dihydroorotase